MSAAGQSGGLMNCTTRGGGLGDTIALLRTARATAVASAVSCMKQPGEVGKAQPLTTTPTLPTVPVPVPGKEVAVQTVRCMTDNDDDVAPGPEHGHMLIKSGSFRPDSDPAWLQQQLQDAWHKIIQLQHNAKPLCGPDDGTDGCNAATAAAALRAASFSVASTPDCSGSCGGEGVFVAPTADNFSADWRETVLSRVHHSRHSSSNKRLIQSENEFLMRLLMATKAELQAAAEGPGPHHLLRVMDMLDKMEIDVSTDMRRHMTC
jgi:hypothetical protein